MKHFPTWTVAKSKLLSSFAGVKRGHLPDLALIYNSHDAYCRPTAADDVEHHINVVKLPAHLVWLPLCEYFGFRQIVESCKM